ncbi:MAG: 50S ribosomal protein L21 [Candidatus Moraniibacteriota bacterium]|nr:MAG: 50S ribosomal protein L21 [Candidatus Moranbacteria bacterium]
MLAVIKTGGKQYRVSEGDELRIEKIDIEEGKEVIFDEILLISDAEKVIVGDPLIKGKKVSATVISQGRDDKVWGMKHNAKKRYKLKFGHKQPHTIVKINSIS